MSNRLLIVSNRLPVTAARREGGVHLTAASGGLATGLRRWHERTKGLWIGWPGDVSCCAPEERHDLDHQLTNRGIVPVYLSKEEIERYYHGYANRVLWPLFHYQIDRVPVDASGCEAYAAVNEVFAEVVSREYRPGDTIWVHDYQLMLLPALLRQRLPDARIGFFLHIPFPSSEVFRVLPWRREILKGLLGADLVGFHTFAYMRHFLSSLLHVEGVEADVDSVRTGDREVRVGAFPMGVDAARFAALAQRPDVVTRVERIRRDAGGRQIVLGVDRLDYTKGIPRRLHAIERLLEREPDLRDTIRYVQVAVPSRGEVDSYQRFKRQVEESVGRINGACGTLGSTPVHYMHRSVSLKELVALYCAADVMLVTPLRDGMNLVAKEFVASRVDEDGVLILSEFAGAAAELDGAVSVNPYDVDAVADSIRRSLSMPIGERRARMRTLRCRVTKHNVNVWAGSFLDRLQAARSFDGARRPAQPAAPVATALAGVCHATPLRLLLDYDGTLVPLARSPELAAPDDELLLLLRALGSAPGIELTIVSGRTVDTLEAWLGELPASLWAEHGFWYRASPRASWQPAMDVDVGWMKKILAILKQFTANTPGSHLEIKTASIAWHFRRAQREFGARQAHELRMLLGDALSNQPLEVLEGKKVIEVRLRGINKALVTRGLQNAVGPGSPVVAIGDDRTDEDLFRALPPSSLTIAVGRQLTCAKHRVADHREVRELLRSLLTARGIAVPSGGRPRLRAVIPA